MSLVVNDTWRKSSLSPGGVYKFTKRGPSTFDFFGGTDCPQRAVFKQDIIVNGSGTFGSSTADTLECDGDIIAFATSDKQFKDNVLAIEDPIERIKQIGGYTFTWNDSTPILKNRGTQDIGVIAQEIEKVLPEVVRTNTVENVKQVRYEKIVPLLIEGIKEQQNQIEILTEKIKKLENK